MNKTKVILILWIASVLISSAGTGYIVYKATFKNPPAPMPQPIISKPVERPPDLSCELAKNHLFHYDNDPFKIDWKTLNQKDKQLTVNIKGNLYQRDFEQTTYLPIEIKSGNWKIGLGFTLGAAAVGGAVYGMHKLGWIKF
jgi:hypothetical protein